MINKNYKFFKIILKNEFEICKNKKCHINKNCKNYLQTDSKLL